MMQNEATLSHKPEAETCPLISVIVPVYKVEKYLDQCVSSIVNQTYRNLEIILVDDGSPDNCPAICDEWVRKDSRVRVIHKANGGPDTARNAGLDAAKGEYIGTIDSDDFIAPDMYEKLYILLTENDADISMCEFVQVDEDGKRLDKQEDPMKDEVISREQMFQRFNQFSLHYCYSWNKLYRAELFREVRFRGGIHDDTGTIHRVLGAAGIIIISSEPLYFYRRRHDSTTDIMCRPSFSYRSFNGRITAFQNRYEYFTGMGRPELADSALSGVIWSLKYALKHLNYWQFRDELKEPVHETVKRTLLSKPIRRKLRIIKFALVWLSSIFRPFVDKEKMK